MKTVAFFAVVCTVLFFGSAAGNEVETILKQNMDKVRHQFDRLKQCADLMVGATCVQGLDGMPVAVGGSASQLVRATCHACALGHTCVADEAAPSTSAVCRPRRVYQPCVGQSVGHLCHLCDPLELNCMETMVEKRCTKAGVCSHMPQPQLDNDDDDGHMVPPPPPQQPLPVVYQPCVGKSVGDVCHMCDPLADVACTETKSLKTCQSDGLCSVAQQQQQKVVGAHNSTWTPQCDTVPFGGTCVQGPDGRPLAKGGSLSDIAARPDCRQCSLGFTCVRGDDGASSVCALLHPRQKKKKKRHHHLGGDGQTFTPQCLSLPLGADCIQNDDGKPVSSAQLRTRMHCRACDLGQSCVLEHGFAVCSDKRQQQHMLGPDGQQQQPPIPEHHMRPNGNQRRNKLRHKMKPDGKRRRKLGPDGKQHKFGQDHSTFTPQCHQMNTGETCMQDDVSGKPVSRSHGEIAIDTKVKCAACDLGQSCIQTLSLQPQCI